MLNATRVRLDRIVGTGVTILLIVGVARALVVDTAVVPNVSADGTVDAPFASAFFCSLFSEQYSSTSICDFVEGTHSLGDLPELRRVSDGTGILLGITLSGVGPDECLDASTCETSSTTMVVDVAKYGSVDLSPQVEVKNMTIKALYHQTAIGSGLFEIGVASQLLLEHVHVTGAVGGGGGVVTSRGGVVTVVDSVFTSPRAVAGGAFFCHGGRLTVDGLLIETPAASIVGGVAYIEDVPIVSLIDVSVRGGSVARVAPGIAVYSDAGSVVDASFMMEQCDFDGAFATGTEGASFVEYVDIGVTACVVTLDGVTFDISRVFVADNGTCGLLSESCVAVQNGLLLHGDLEACEWTCADGYVLDSSHDTVECRECAECNCGAVDNALRVR